MMKRRNQVQIQPTSFVLLFLKWVKGGLPCEISAKTKNIKNKREQKAKALGPDEKQFNF